MFRNLLTLAISFICSLTYAQDLQVFLNPRDCISCVAQMDMLFEYSTKAEMTIVSDKANAYLIEEMLKKEIDNLDTYNYDFVINDSLYRSNLHKTAYRSFLRFSYQGKFIANFVLKTFYSKKYNEKLDEVLVNLKNPLLNFSLKYPIYYPKITSKGFYSINKTLERLEYYYKKEGDLACDEISYDEIEELSLRAIYTEERYKDVKEFTRLKNENNPRWGYLSLGNGGNVYGVTLMISYTFLHVVDTHNYQMNVIYGIIWICEGNVVDVRIPINENIYTLKNWPGIMTLIKYRDQIIIDYDYEGKEKSFEIRYCSLAELTDSDKIMPVPIFYDSTLYYSYFCSHNVQSFYFQSGAYMGNVRSFLEVVNLKELNTFKVPWNMDIINEHFSQRNDTCFCFAVLGFTEESKSFKFLIFDENKKNNGWNYSVLTHKEGETKYRYLPMLSDHSFAAFFGKSLVIGFNEAELKWEPVTMY